MNSDVPFIITVKASSIYDNNNRYNIINNIKNKELINCLREHIVFVNEGGEDDFLFVDKDYYYYYIYLCVFRI